MDAERRALYNSLRINWQLDPNLAVEPWQVEDYRSMPLNNILERLKLQDIELDKNSFLAISQDFDTPEELTDHLIGDQDVDPKTQDQIYLLVFELWRRLIPEKLAFTVFCDEIDYQINLYDSGKIENVEIMQDTIANLQVVLDENTDQGVDPIEAFELISQGCANDLESFLYDYIAEQIDAGDDLYATELLDDFSAFVKDVKWFDFLRARLQASIDPALSDQLIRNIIDEATTFPELEFNLEVMTFMVIAGKKEDFLKLIKKTLPLLKTEEDFQDLLSIVADFYHRLDLDDIEIAILDLVRKRSQRPLEKPFITSDPDIATLFQVII